MICITRNVWRILFKFCLAFFLIGLLLKFRVLNYKLIGALRNPEWLVFALFLQYICYLFTSGRFYYVMRAAHVKTTYLNCLVLNMTSIFMMQLVPGGELIRLGIAGKSTEGRMSPVLLSVIVDRLMGICGMGVVALMAWFLSPFMFSPGLWTLPGARWILAIILALIGGPCVALYILMGEARMKWFTSLTGRLPQGIQGKIPSLFWIPRGGVSLRRVIGIGFLASVTNHLLTAVMVYFVARALLGPGVGMFQFFLLVPIGFAVNAGLPLTPMGIGIGETAFHFLFQWIPEMPTSHAGAEIMLMYRVVYIFSLLPGGVLWTRLKKFTVPEHHAGMPGQC